MGIALGVAVIAAVAWLLVLVGRHVIGVDRRARLAAATHETESRLIALAQTRPGASAEQAIVVSSVSQIEPRFERDPCPRCGGRLHVDEHRVHTEGDRRLRVVDGHCGTCGLARRTYFELAPVDAANVEGSPTGRMN